MLPDHLLFFLIGFVVLYFTTRNCPCQSFFDFFEIFFAVKGIAVDPALVLEAVDRSRDTSASLYKCLTGELVYRHDRCITKESAKLYGLAYALADHRDHS